MVTHAEAERCPAALYLGAQLTSIQWHTVWRLESQMKAVGRSGNIALSQMGRTAARVEGLEAVIGFLHVEAMNWPLQAMWKDHMRLFLLLLIATS